MEVGTFTLEEYLSKLNESTVVDGGLPANAKDGIIIPDGETKKAYDWLKKEYDKSKTEVKVEMKMGGIHFEPYMDFQTDVETTKNFKAGLFGAIKTSDTEGGKSSDRVKEIDDKAGNVSKNKDGMTAKKIKNENTEDTEDTDKKIKKEEPEKKIVKVDIRKEKEEEEKKEENIKKKDDDS